MATALKDMYGPDIPARIAEQIATVHPAFPVDGFLADALDGYDDLELTPRARHIADALARHLPDDFDEAISILLASLGPPIAAEEPSGIDPFLYAPHVYFVAAHGLDHWETSMHAQYELTQRFTAEFSIRAFLDHEPDRTLARLRDWTRDPSAHVRRLVSEGTRPRLPWAPRLRRFQDDPTPVLELLEQLKDDPSLYVRRSVANNLNDIGKDHPQLLVETARRWMTDATDERRWLIRHALRSAVKRGDRAALAVMGFEGDGSIDIEAVDIKPARVRIGESVRISMTVTTRSETPSPVNIDLRVHFVKANGSTSPKVFKLRSLELAPGVSQRLSKLVSLKQHTTRTHHPGDHRVEALVNGVAQPLGSFVVSSGAAPSSGAR
jgi:3-methyladenine DNA glycosylase AlkC